MQNAYIFDGIRTPFGRHAGCLSAVGTGGGSVVVRVLTLCRVFVVQVWVALSSNPHTTKDHAKQTPRGS